MIQLSQDWILTQVAYWLICRERDSGNKVAHENAVSLFILYTNTANKQNTERSNVVPSYSNPNVQSHVVNKLRKRWFFCFLWFLFIADRIDEEICQFPFLCVCVHYCHSYIHFFFRSSPARHSRQIGTIRLSSLCNVSSPLTMLTAIWHWG